MSSPFIGIKEQNALRITYFRADGSSSTFIGGTRTWRNQNPGNIVASGPFAKAHGAIGRAGGFAVFPSYEIGRAAIFSLMGLQKYQDNTLAATIGEYAPEKDGNNPERYRKLVHKWTGLDLKRKVKDLSKKELECFVNAIERMEGYRAGKIVEDASATKKGKISAVQKDDKGIIVAYYVVGLGWLAKGAAIALASKGKIDAVVATSRSGSLYLRTRPDQTGANNLDAMG